MGKYDNQKGYSVTINNQNQFLTALNRFKRKTKDLKQEIKQKMRYMKPSTLKKILKNKQVRKYKRIQREKNGE